MADVIVTLLSDFGDTQNSIAFLAPVLWNRSILRRAGIEIRITNRLDDRALECDVLAINSRIWPGNWYDHRDIALAFIDKARKRARRVVFFDRTSTAGFINTDIVGVCDIYLKPSLYKDRDLYRRSVHSNRLFAEYYHREFGVEDDVETPQMPPLEESDLGRLGISWNTGLANYAWWGPRIASYYRRARWSWLMEPRPIFRSPTSSRKVSVSCRLGTEHRYNTVAYQRRKVREVLAGYGPSGRVTRREFVQELGLSRIVASPFGFSEINYRDFETFLAGAALLKPDMSHLDTWPDLFHKNETYISHRWDFSDLHDVVVEHLADSERTLQIAQNGSDRYRQAFSAVGRDEFVKRLASFLTPS